MLEFTFHQWVVLLTIAGSMVLFVTDALRYDVIAILVVLVLSSTGTLSTVDAFSAFSSPAPILIATMYVFGHAITRWGVAATMGEKLLAPSRSSEAVLAFRVMLVSGLFSSVLSNTGVVATMIPILSSVSAQTRIPASRLLMPASFGSLLGGQLSVLGSSHNIAINEVIRNHPGHEPFALFEFTLFGLVILAIGCIYFLGPGRLLLPATRKEETLSEHYQVPRFVSEVLVRPSSRLVDRAVGEIKIFDKHNVTVLGIVRPEGEGVLAPSPYNRIRREDTLILQGEPEAIVRLQHEIDLEERDSVQVGDKRLSAGDVQLLEAVVPTSSPLVGRTLAEAEFRAKTGINVLAISKHGDVKPATLAGTRLEIGDALLIQGHERDIDRLRKSRELLILGDIDQPPIGRGGMITLLMLLGVLLVAALTPIDLTVAAVAGALGLVLTKVVRPEEARDSVNWSVLVLVGGMLALGRAFEGHELGQVVAGWIHGLGDGTLDIRLTVALLMFATMVLTQLVNHVSSAVIMTPVALSLSEVAGIDDRTLLMAVLTGAGMAFMSPVAHQANTMVMGPGDYRFRDFLRAGSPLTAVTFVAATLLIPVFWPA